jgi:hypothetical protein
MKIRIVYSFFQSFCSELQTGHATRYQPLFLQLPSTLDLLLRPLLKCQELSLTPEISAFRLFCLRLVCFQLALEQY